MKPIIGVIADMRPNSRYAAQEVKQKYLEAITIGAGGLAIILPAFIAGGAWSDPADFTQILGHLDALFLPGAVSNVAPERYGAAPLDPPLPGDAARDAVSLALIGRAIALGLPVLGVCRGLQEINVALGGTLHQAVHDLPGFNDHRERPELDLAAQYGPAHEIRIHPGGLLARATGLAGATVNSLHGQGIDRLAPGLVAEAHAPDGLIEAVRLEVPHPFLLAVQWHPESNFRDDPLSSVIFSAFGDAARAYRAARR